MSRKILAFRTLSHVYSTHTWKLRQEHCLEFGDYTVVFRVGQVAV